MKQIPNLFTLLNLVCGCIAIVLILQTNQTIVVADDSNLQVVVLPENIFIGAFFIFAAAIIDFLDGFVARLMHAQSEMGKQLDSLSDVVSFGVAPGMILYQLLRMSYAQEENGLDVTVWALIPAFIYTAAAAWRLAKFNISTNQSHSFRGIPSPAAGLLIASFPLIIWYQYFNIQSFFVNKWVLYAIIVVVSYLMVCNIRFMALKFKDYSIKNNVSKYILLLTGIIAAVLLKWLAVPLVFLVYVLVSLFVKEKAVTAATMQKETLDVSV